MSEGLFKKRFLEESEATLEAEMIFRRENITIGDKVVSWNAFQTIMDEFRKDVLEKAKTSLWIYNEAYYNSWDRVKNEKWIPESVVLKWLGEKK